MKKIVFYISIGIVVLITIDILRIVTSDLSRLTEYGYGYLVGKVILLLVFGGLIFITRKRQAKA